MEKLTLVTQKFIATNIKYQEWRAATSADIATIPTSDLAVGSSVIVANSTADFYQWNGTSWVMVE